MLKLGTKASNLHLKDAVSGQIISLETFADKKALLVMFICKHCPYVQHVKKKLSQIGKDYSGKSLGIVAISANDISAYPEDGPQGLKQMAQESGFTFPYCYDETQETAKAYTAACTPDFFLFDRQRLVYRGQLDNSRPGNDIPLTGRDLRDAINAVLEGKIISKLQKPSVGCSIKWKPGNEPDYFK